MKNLLHYLLFFIFTSTFAQEVILQESFEEKAMSDSLLPIIWGSPNGGKPIADFLFTNIGHEDKSSLKVIVRKKAGKIPFKASFNILNFQLSNKKTYKLSFYVKSRTSNDKIGVSIYSDKRTGAENKKLVPLFNKELPFNGNGQWFKKEFIFKASKKNERGDFVDLKRLGLRFGFNTRRGTFYIDDVKLERI